MADGSVVRVAGDSELRLERLKYSLTKKRADTSLALDKGRVESRVPPQRPSGSRFQIDTPLMAAGVRGTEFGVSMRDGSAATSDVLEGEVELRVLRSGAAARVGAGTGGAVAANAQAATLAPLLAAPDLTGVSPCNNARSSIWHSRRSRGPRPTALSSGPRVPPSRWPATS